MPTNETPSAGAVTRAYTTQETCQAARHTITGMCAHCAALALETFARELCDKGDQAWEKICREREATVWEKASKVPEAHADRLIALAVENSTNVFIHGLLIDEACVLLNVAEDIRARAAEERTKP